MKNTLILLAFLFSSFALSAQQHNMKYRFGGRERDYWILEEKTNVHTDSKIKSPEGKVLPPQAGLVPVDDISREKERNLIKETLTPPVLQRYQSQGLVDFAITYIIFADGSVDEVSFHFYSFDGKLNITGEEMLLWRKLSDALKENLRFTMRPDKAKVQFYKVNSAGFISKLLAPEQPLILRSNSVNKNLKREVNEVKKIDSAQMQEFLNQIHIDK